MTSSVIPGKTSELYVTEVGGRFIECESLADLITLKIAEAIAAAGRFDLDDPSAMRLVTIARQYGFDAIADAIEALS